MSKFGCDGGIYCSSRTRTSQLFLSFVNLFSPSRHHRIIWRPLSSPRVDLVPTSCLKLISEQISEPQTNLRVFIDISFLYRSIHFYHVPKPTNFAIVLKENFPASLIIIIFEDLKYICLFHFKPKGTHGYLKNQTNVISAYVPVSKNDSP